MRIVQICFRLHEPYELADFDRRELGAAGGDYPETEKTFREADEKIYQPLLAFLERNTQKYRDFRVSLQISGTWLELAERYDITLVQRLKKLVKAERVEVVGGLYYNSLAYFWDKEEATEQVRMYREKIDQLFGVKGRVLMMPDLLYDNMVGQWAEKNGFAGMLITGEQRVLDWRNSNHVYEAAGCEYLRLLLVNEKLSRLVARGDESILVEKEVEADDGKMTTKKMFALEKFVKQLDLAVLRGGLVNLYWDSKIFAEQRDKGLIGFLDDLVELLNSGKKGDRMVGAAEACVVEEPKMELSVERIIARGDLELERPVADVVVAGEKIQESGLVLKSAVKSELPLWLRNEKRKAVQDELYGLLREIMASEDAVLIADFRRLMALDYIVELGSDKIGLLERIRDGLKQRAVEVKKSQAVEISRAYTKRRDRGGAERDRHPAKSEEKSNSGPVKVVFATRLSRPGMESRAVHKAPDEILVKMPEAEGEHVAVHRILADRGVGEEVSGVQEGLVEVGTVADSDVSGRQAEKEQAGVAKKHTIRKIIKRLVIE